MTSTAVRFHPAAAQEVECTYDWYARSPDAAHGFREEVRRAVEAVAASPEIWPRYGSRARRYLFPDIPSVSSTSSELTTSSRWSRSLMVVAGLDIGGRASDVFLRS